MEDNAGMETQMDEYLANIQRQTKDALIGFKQAGKKFTKTFIGHLRTVTINRLDETYARFSLEANWKAATGSKRQSEHTTTSDAEPSKKKKKKEKSNLVEHIDLTGESAAKAAKLVNRRKSIVTEQCKAIAADKKNANTTHKQHGQGNLKRTKYFCVYCLDQENYSQTESFGGTIDEVYGHWLDKHANQSLSKPFRFNAVPLVVCFHCEYVGIYHDVVIHHEEQHSGQQLLIVNKRDSKRCGVCNFKDGNLFEHFQTEHDSNAKSNAFNPIKYSEKRIAELLKISVHKKHQCQECKEIFETEQEIIEHFTAAHNGQMVQSKEVVVGNRSTPDHMICGYCHEKLDCTKLLNHFWEHTYNFYCSQCSYQSADLSELICHEHSVHAIDNVKSHCDFFPDWIRAKLFNSDIVFHNGLTLKMFNVLKTKFDESKSFDVFIDGFLDLKKKEATKKIKLIEMNKNASQASNASTLHGRAQTGSNAASNRRHSIAIESATTFELMKQQQLAKNIYLYGIENNMRISSLERLFIRLCRLIRVDIKLSDIEEIVQMTRGVLVKFHELEKKDMFMCQKGTPFVQAKDLLPLRRGERSWRIYIQNDMTSYYYDILRAAKDLRNRNILHSFHLVFEGFAVKLTAAGAECIVQSKEELMDLVKKDSYNSNSFV